MQKVVFTLLLISLFSCSNAKKASQNKSVEQIAQASSNNYRFGISFYSIGTGIDGTARQQMLDFIAVFEEKNHIKVSPEKFAWGKEGEVDYCFKLSELNRKQQEKFVEDLKQLLKKSTRIHYKEFSDCAR